MKGISRRWVIVGAAGAAGAALFGVSVPHLRRELRAWRAAKPLGTTPWIRIDPAGTVTTYVNVVEMGQGAASGLMQGLADELDVPWERVLIETAPVAAAYSAPWGYSTGGSRSIRALFDTYRRIGAGARRMLLDAGARRWGVSVDECGTRPGFVVHQASGREWAYGVIASEAAAMSSPRNVELRARGDWRFIGKQMARLQGERMIDGTATYGIDVKLPGLRVAAIRHCPVLGGSLASVDEAPARAMQGVRAVVMLDNAVAVVADGYWQAQQAVKALEPAWNPGPGAAISSELLRRNLSEQLASERQLASISDSKQRTHIEQVESELRGEGVITATYEVPLLTQAALEPMNATARVADDVVEIWAPTQAASDAQVEVAEALGVSKDSVRIHPTLIGGGFGRRLNNDYAVQAALIARAAKAPVKLIWSREEDMQHSFYRVAAMARLRARLGPDGLPHAMRIEATSLDTYRRLGGLDDLPYRFPHFGLTYAGIDTVVPIGSWRSVDMSQNTFFVEAFLDECAAAAKRDPIDYRLAILAHHPRAIAVLRALHALTHWDTAPGPGRARGVALAEGFGSVVAQAVEVEATPEGVALRRISCVLDCGLAINPASIDAQVRGGIVYALSAALLNEITLSAGRVEQSNFETYRMLRGSQLPPIDVRILGSSDAEPGGVGEPPVPALAPAVVNAVSRLTGQRIRSLPLRKNVAIAL